VLRPLGDGEPVGGSRDAVTEVAAGVDWRFARGVGMGASVMSECGEVRAALLTIRGSRSSARTNERRGAAGHLEVARGREVLPLVSSATPRITRGHPKAGRKNSDPAHARKRKG